jgi:uncharacterized membrane protein YfcA
VPDQLPFVVLALAGLGVGFVVGLTGMGGGALMTPVLVLLFGVDPARAVGSDLLVSLLMKPVGGGVHLRRGTVERPLVAWLVLGSVPSAFASVWIFSRLFGDQLSAFVQYAIGAALLAASAGLIVKGAFGGRAGVGDATPIVVRPLPTLAVGVFGGAAVGITSVGSGSLMMPLLLALYPALSARRLVGTDLVQAVPLVGAAALGHALFGHVELGLTAALLVGALPGAWLGAHVSSRAADHVIRPVLAVLLVVSGLKMLALPSMVVGVVGLVLAGGAVVVARRRGPADRDGATAATGSREAWSVPGAEAGPRSR